MKHFLILVVLLGMIHFSLQIREMSSQNTEEWIPLFNGKDLTGWDIKIADRPLNDNYLNTFQVEEGMLRIVYDAYENFDEKVQH